VHVALSLLTLFPGRSGGTETYARALVAEYARGRGTEPLVTLLVSEQVARALRDAGLPMHLVSSYRTGDSAPTRLLAMALAGVAPSVVGRDVPEGIDVVHYPVTVPIPRVTGAASVVSLNDVQHHELPEFFSGPERHYRRWAYDRAARRADEVLTLSEHARGQIVERLGIPAERVTAIPCAVDHERFTPAPNDGDAMLDLPQRFLLYPANLWPHKNHARLLRAFASVGVTDLHLVLTGQTYGRPLPGPPNERVRHLGHVPFEHLPALYRRATATVFPSLFEGFGIPLVEAMASGCPVTATARGAIAETCGSAALLFDAEDEDAIADAIAKIVEDGDMRERLRADGLARAARFRWDDVASRHVDVYRRALARRERTARSAR
jgi:glycosyltransferase involved in cell wall biosynthesis